MRSGWRNSTCSNVSASKQHDSRLIGRVWRPTVIWCYMPSAQEWHFWAYEFLFILILIAKRSPTVATHVGLVISVFFLKCVFFFNDRGSGQVGLKEFYHLVNDTWRTWQFNHIEHYFSCLLFWLSDREEERTSQSHIWVRPWSCFLQRIWEIVLSFHDIGLPASRAGFCSTACQSNRPRMRQRMAATHQMMSFANCWLTLFHLPAAW